MDKTLVTSPDARISYIFCNEFPSLSFFLHFRAVLASHDKNWPFVEGINVIPYLHVSCFRSLNQLVQILMGFQLVVRLASISRSFHHDEINDRYCVYRRAHDGSTLKEPFDSLCFAAKYRSQFSLIVELRVDVIFLMIFTPKFLKAWWIWAGVATFRPLLNCVQLRLYRSKY